VGTRINRPPHRRPQPLVLIPMSHHVTCDGCGGTQITSIGTPDGWATLSRREMHGTMTTYGPPMPTDLCWRCYDSVVKHVAKLRELANA
jgi:hypothetical protein